MEETFTHSTGCRIPSVDGGECQNPADHVLVTDIVGGLVEACWACTDRVGFLVVADIEADGLYVVEREAFDKGRRITETLRALFAR